MKRFFNRLHWRILKKDKQCKKACAFCKYYDFCKKELQGNEKRINQ